MVWIGAPCMGFSWNFSCKCMLDTRICWPCLVWPHSSRAIVTTFTHVAWNSGRCSRKWTRPLLLVTRGESGAWNWIRNGPSFFTSTFWSNSNVSRKIIIIRAHAPSIEPHESTFLSFRLFNILEDIISGTIFAQLLSNVIFFASSMYQLEMVRQCQSEWLLSFSSLLIQSI